MICSLVNRCARVVACLCLVAAFTPLALAAPVERAERPETAVAAIQTALDQADLALFEQRVDVDALIDEGSAVFMSKLLKAGETGELPPALALLATAAGTPQGALAMRGMLAGEAAAFVRDGVASGRFGGGKAGKGSAGKSRGLLAPLFANASTGRKHLRAVGRALPVTSAGDVVELPVAIRDEGNGREYRLRLRLEQYSDSPAGASPTTTVSPYWKVTGIADLPAIADQIWEEAVPPKSQSSRSPSP